MTSSGGGSNSSVASADTVKETPVAKKSVKDRRNLRILQRDVSHISIFRFVNKAFQRTRSISKMEPAV